MGLEYPVLQHSIDPIRRSATLMVKTKKSKRTTGSNTASVRDERWLHFYRQMLKIRLFEEEVNQLYLGAKMPGLAHLYIGEEAVAVGVCEALRQTDYITSTHRGHGHCIAKGAKLDNMFAELLGKAAGYCRGKGGSMHIADQESGNLGWAGEAHVAVVSLVGTAGGRGGGFRVGHAGCHQRPASTTPAESSRLSPIMRSPSESV